MAIAMQQRSGERILLALLVGTHWTIAWVVPFMFANLDKPVAGELNAKLLSAEAIISLFVVALLLLLGTLRSRMEFLKTWRAGLLALLGVIAAFVLFYVYPTMQAVPNDSATFENFHRLSSSLYIVTGFLGLALVAFQE